MCPVPSARSREEGTFQQHPAAHHFPKGTPMPPLASRRTRPCAPRPCVEWLERRVLLSAGDSVPNAVDLSFTASQAAHVSATLAAGAVRIYQVTLDAGDVVRAAVDTSRSGGGLNSYLRVFQTSG